MKKYSADQIGLFLFGTYGLIIPMLTSLAKYPDLLKLRVFDSDSCGTSGYIEYAGDICVQVRFTAYAFDYNVNCCSVNMLFSRLFERISCSQASSRLSCPLHVMC